MARGFGVQGSGPALARPSVLADIGNDLVVDASVAALFVGAHEPANAQFAAAKPGDPMHYDDGYAAFWFFVLHR